MGRNRYSFRLKEEKRAIKSQNIKELWKKKRGIMELEYKLEDPISESESGLGALIKTINIRTTGINRFDDLYKIGDLFYEAQTRAMERFKRYGDDKEDSKKSKKTKEKKTKVKATDLTIERKNIRFIINYSCMMGEIMPFVREHVLENAKVNNKDLIDGHIYSLLSDRDAEKLNMAVITEVVMEKQEEFSKMQEK